MSLTLNITGNVIVQTASEWALDSTVYPATKILETSNEYWTGTINAKKFKIANGIDSWVGLDYPPIGTAPVVNTLYSADDSLAGNRNVDGGSAYSLSFTDLTKFRLESPQTPSSGNPSLQYQAGGTMPSHISHQFQVRAETTPVSSLELYGNGDARHFGPVQMPYLRTNQWNDFGDTQNLMSYVAGSFPGGGSRLVVQQPMMWGQLNFLSASDMLINNYNDTLNVMRLNNDATSKFYNTMEVTNGTYTHEPGSLGSFDPSAIVEIKSSARGFLPPRMSFLQRSTIGSPADGLIVYQTDTVGLDKNGLYAYKATPGAWDRFAMASDL